MKFVALVSGGKDSCFNVLHCLKQGHALAAFANLYPADETEQELDSYMFQTVGHDIVSYYEQCVGVPLFRQQITHGSSRNVEMNYTVTKDDEIEDLYSLLKTVKDEIPDVEAVSVGAILSSYQRTRVEDVCRRLNLTVLSFLWQRNQLELMNDMCYMSKDQEEQESGAANMDARIIKVAAVGLDQSHLNMSLPQIFPIMKKLNRMYDVHICGEGGEFETMVLDAPFFVNGSIEVVDQLVNTTEESNGVYNTQLEVVFKPRNEGSNLNEALERLPIPPLLDDKWSCLLDSMPKFEEQKLVKPACGDPSKRPAPSPAVSVAQVGGLLYISNIRANLESLSVEDQTEDVLKQLSSIMEKMGVVPSRAISCSLILQSMSHFSTVNSIYNRFFDISRNGPLPPSRACVESNTLGEHSLLQLSVVFDMTCPDIKVLNGTTVYQNKNGLHVQGRSYWAPSNIGPYSQAIWLNSNKNKVSFLSGQIPLVPSSMEMAAREPVLQCILSLRHFDTLKVTIAAKRQLFMTCFVTDDTMAPVVSQAWSLYCDGMQYESEYWLDKEDDPVECLICVEVSHLPRSALCEWSGVTCQELSVTDPADEDCLEGKTNSTTRMQIEDNSSCVVSTIDVTSGHGRSRFITGFADSLNELKMFMDSTKSSYKATLYFNPSSFQDYSALENTEFTPVEKVFDCHGKQHEFGFHLMT